MADAMIYHPNPVAIQVIGNGPRMRTSLRSVTDRIRDAAQGAAPVLTGEYRDSIQVVDGTEAGMGASAVVTNDPKALFIEFGTEDTPAFAPLRRGLDSSAGGVE